MIDNAEQKRLKKERKFLRVTFTAMVPDEMDFDWAVDGMKDTMNHLPLFVEECSVFTGWKDRK